MAKFLPLLAAVASAKLLAEPALPSDWYDSANPVAADEAMHVLVALPRQNMNKLEEVALAISTPGHELYGDHLDWLTVSLMTAAAEADVAAALAWLGPSATLRGDGSTVEAALTVAEVEAAFKTTVRRVAAGGRSALRAADVSVPVNHDAVFGLHGLPHPFATAGPPKKAPATVTPAVVAKAYGIEGTVSGSPKVRQAVAEFQGQTMNQTDLTAFFAEYTSAPAADAKVYAFHGEPKVGGDGVEAMLDVEYIMGLAPGLKTEFYEQLNMDFCSDLKNWTSLLLATADVPLVHSVSYGIQANLTELGCAPGALASIDGDFAKLAARGVTIIFASGDSGSGYTGSAPPPPLPVKQCTAESHTADAAWKGSLSWSIEIGPPDVKSLDEAMATCCEQASVPDEGDDGGSVAWDVSLSGTRDDDGVDYTCNMYTHVTKTKKKKGSYAGKTVPVAPITGADNLWPSWPAGSPWVTAVGATRFIGDKISTAAEAAVSEEDGFGSGGGFSWNFAAPAYQKADVAKYLKTATLPKAPAAWNKAGRGTPDVSALGTGFTLWVSGQAMPGVGGTSASAPVFASVVSRLNDARVAAGKKPMGFLNPFLYANPQAFTDVTVGSDKVGRGGDTLEYGFDCAKGWDPVTGLGTPKFAELLKAAMK